MTQLALIALAGALGSVSRYGVSLAVHGVMGDGFPYGTFVANVLGCFLFGVIWTLADHRVMLSPETKLVFLTGFMGAFTTFSTYIFDSHQLLGTSGYVLAIGNLLTQIVIGLIAFQIGHTLAMIGHSG